ncbi:hypothetical protein FZI51_20970 [Cronobacter sakazakii]|uniref:hypothetical protein n=1 Tax=Cronobacter sakazakii TaxID=28141 RepID=UPI0013F86FD1|nr:hypothetical protein FZI51_20970 [Cronobacter sakazakii]
MMFAAGDIVQPRLGGPKLKVIEVHGDQIVAVRPDDEQGEKVTLKAADVALYKEDGDFLPTLRFYVWRISEVHPPYIFCPAFSLNACSLSL